MPEYTTKESKELFKRAVKVLPGGIPGHVGPIGSSFFPASAFPFYSDRAKDSYFWDVDGNKYLDYMCAYGPNVLGYNNDVVDQAFLSQLKSGNCMPLPGKVQIELAELLCDTIDIAEWSLFFKNGGDATTVAVMIARSATGRKKLVRIDGGYHGVAAWTQASGAPGVTNEDVANNLMMPWNDVEAFEKLVAEYDNQIAALIATPYQHITFGDNILPEDGYWQKIQKICNDKGIVLILDDVRCGFRLDLAGSGKYFGFEPDLACYCKALANGYNISALVGKDSLKQAAMDVFFTGSYWHSAAPMAAAIACISELKRLDGAKLMIRMGEKLNTGLVDLGKNHGIEMVASGVPSLPYYRIANDNSFIMTQEWAAECTKRGAFFVCHHNHFINCSLTDEDIKQTLEIADAAYAIVAKNHQDLLIH